MPNHFLTVGLCGRDYGSLDAAGIDDYDNVNFRPLIGANLCEIACKLPDELIGIETGSGGRYRYRNKETGEFSNTFIKVCPTNPDELNKWERVPLSGEEAAELVAKYGAADWYEWQNQNWGTKWGTYQTTVRTLGGDGSPILIEFQSAWGPPSPQAMRSITDHLCETYHLQNIRWIGHDPYDGSTVDIEVAPATEAKENQ